MHPLKRGPTMDLLVLPTTPGNKLVGMIIKLKQKILTLFLVQEMPLLLVGACISMVTTHYAFVIFLTHIDFWFAKLEIWKLYYLKLWETSSYNDIRYLPSSTIFTAFITLIFPNLKLDGKWNKFACFSSDMKQSTTCLIQELRTFYQIWLKKFSTEIKKTNIYCTVFLLWE